jgi:hypothetical protein
LIGEWRDSGIDLAEFCRERGIPPSSFRWWRWRLGRSSIPSADPARGGVARRPERNEWIRLEIESSSSKSGAFELRWPSGMVLAIPADFDAEALGRLLAAVERSAC